METKRKLQLGAASVILNGLAVLVALGPAPALATTCPDQGYCGSCLASDELQGCTARAPAGCTYVSATCNLGVCLPQGRVPLVTCHYH